MSSTRPPRICPRVPGAQGPLPGPPSPSGDQARRQRTAIRVDAQVSWIPARPAGEKVPLAAKAVTISEDIGGNQGRAKPQKPVTITSPAQLRELVAPIDGLPLTPPGVFSCPAGFGDNLALTFRAGPRTPALAVATVELSGCREVDFAIGGKPQPALGAASGPRY